MKSAISTTLQDQYGLSYDSKENTFFGTYQGFPVYIVASTDDNKLYTIGLSVQKQGQGISDDQLARIKEYGTQSLNTVHAKGFKLTATVKASLGSKKTAEKLGDAFNDLLHFLKDNEFVACCEETGETANLEVYAVGNAIAILSPQAYDKYHMENEAALQEQRAKSENYLTGTVGALLGSLIGVAAIVAIGQLGYVTWLSGLIMGVCAVKGYELLGKKFTTKSAIICLVIVIVMTYFANDLDLAVSVARDFNLDIFSAFQVLGAYKAEGGFQDFEYWSRLGLLALFTLVAAVAVIFSALQDNKKQFVIRRLLAEEA